MGTYSETDIKRTEPSLTGVLVQQQKILSDLFHLEKRLASLETVLHDQNLQNNDLHSVVSKIVTEQQVLTRETARRDAKINPYKVAFFSALAAFVFGIVMWWLTKPPTIVMPYNYNNPTQYDKTR